MGWFEYIYEIDWQEERGFILPSVDNNKLHARGVEVPLNMSTWMEWLSNWREKIAESKKDIFTKRNQRFLYFVDGRKKIYSRVLLKGGVVGLFVEILAGTVEWSLQRGIQVLFDTISPPRSRRYFIVVDDIKKQVEEHLPEKIVLLPGELEFDVIYVSDEEEVEETIQNLMIQLEKEEIIHVSQNVTNDNMAIIWDGSLMLFDASFVYSKVPVIGFNRYMAMRYMPNEIEELYDILYELGVAERTPLFSIHGFDENLMLISSYIRLISPEGEGKTMRGISLFETLHLIDSYSVETLRELYDFFALMLPRLSTSAPFGGKAETLFPLLAVEGNLVHYFIPREYVAYLITKEVMQHRQEKD